MKKNSAFRSIVLLLALSLLTACGGAKPAGEGAGADDPAPGEEVQEPANSLEAIRAAGVMKVGVDTSYPPMEFVDEDGKTPIGFDIDLARAVAEKLGVEAEFVVIDWAGIQTGLLGGHYDVIISSMTATEERQKEMDFVQYLEMGIAYATRPGVEVKSDADLAGKVVVVQEETTAHYYVEGLMQNGIEPAQLKSFPYATDAFRELANGMADVVAIDAPVAIYYTQIDPNQYQITGTAELEPEPIGIALRKGEAELKEALEQAVAELEAEGKILELRQKWFGDAPGI